MKQWYESLFANYAKKYDSECFVRGTIGECDFIESEIGRDTTKRILDIGCGTGRHSIELARRGYELVGVDLADAQLARAREKAAALGVTMRFEQHDARALPFDNEFDLVIMLCEGAFPLMETDEMNYAILTNAARALKQKGRLIFTTLNGLFPLFHSVKEFLDAEAQAGNARYDGGTFDLLTFRDHNVTSIEDDDGKKIDLTCDERYYVPPEITWLLKSLGFTTIDIRGAKIGAFSRNDRLTPDDFEMLVIAEK